MISIPDLHSIYLTSNGVSIDSRTLEHNQVFYAIKGESFDGHDYINDVLGKGALLCVVDDERFTHHPKCAYVPNVLASLHRLAYYHRSQFDIPVIAITGTNGKTTTKEILKELLSQKFSVLATAGNLNNHLGVPLTLLRLQRDARIAVIEMGANHVGEINWLCHVANPTHGIVTNIGKAHLEGYISIEKIRRTKYELYHYVQSRGGTLFFNVEEISLAHLEDHFSNLSSFDSTKIPGTVQSLKFDLTHLFIKLTLLGQHYAKTNLYGKYNCNNILNAVGIASYFGVEPESIVKGLEHYRPENNRSQFVRKGGNTFFLDAYNANPSSMSQALAFFSSIQSSRKVLILGDMLELGPNAHEEHRKLLDQALEIPDVLSVFLVGEIFSEIANDFKYRAFCSAWLSVNNLKAHLDKDRLTDAHILVKGSRGIQLEKLV